MIDEHRIFREQARARKKNEFRNLTYQEIYDNYKSIYTDYLTNLLVNLFDYENVPDTFNPQALEYLLRYFGYANVIAIDSKNIFVEGIEFDQPNVNFNLGSIIGGLAKPNQGENVGSMLANNSAQALTRLNVNKAKAPVYITIPNKYSFYFSSNCSDQDLINSTACFLAEIKASIISNLRQQKTPFIAFTKDNSLSSKAVFDQLQAGQPFITVDSDVTDDDIKKLITTMPVQSPNLAPTLADSWHTAMGEFLQMTGIDASSVDKKERLTADESNSEKPQVSASLNVYLKARQSQIDLLNKVLHSNIKVSLSSSGLDDILNFAETGTGVLSDDDSNEGEQNDD